MNAILDVIEEIAARTLNTMSIPYKAIRQNCLVILFKAFRTITVEADECSLRYNTKFSCLQRSKSKCSFE